MKTTVVTANDLAGTGRWDPQFHQLVSEHKALYLELRELSLDTLVQLATSLPYDRSADVVVRGGGVRSEPTFTQAAFLDWAITRKENARHVRRHQSDMAAYVAVAGSSALNHVKEAQLELRKQELRLVEGFADAVKLAKKSKAAALVEALKKGRTEQ